MYFSAVDDEQTNEMTLNLNFYKHISPKLFYERFKLKFRN